MKSKTKKVLKTILFILLTLLGATIFVLYCLYPNDIKSLGEYVYDLLNKPLPIVGFTTLAVLMFAWEVFKNSKLGKSMLVKYEQKQKELEKEYHEFLDSANSKIKELEKELESVREQLASVCNLSTNKRINNFGKELTEYGERKETIDN